MSQTDCVISVKCIFDTSSIKGFLKLVVELSAIEIDKKRQSFLPNKEKITVNIADGADIIVRF